MKDYVEYTPEQKVALNALADEYQLILGKRSSIDINIACAIRGGDMAKWADLERESGALWERMLQIGSESKAIWEEMVRQTNCR